MKNLQTAIQNFSNKYPDFTISFGRDDRTGVNVYITSDSIVFYSHVDAHCWSKEDFAKTYNFFKEELEVLESIESERHFIFLDFENIEEPNKFFVFFLDRRTNQFSIKNPENIPFSSINRIIQDYSVIAEAFNQILVDYKKRGMDFIEKTYSWISPDYWDRNSGEIHLSHAGGFSIYHFNCYPDGSGCWEFDSNLKKDTVRQLKRVLKYKN